MEILFPDNDLLVGVNWVHNYNETYDIQEDENEKYLGINEIDIEEGK